MFEWDGSYDNEWYHFSIQEDSPYTFYLCDSAVAVPVFHNKDIDNPDFLTHLHRAMEARDRYFEKADRSRHIGSGGLHFYPFKFKLRLDFDEAKIEIVEHPCMERGQTNKLSFVKKDLFDSTVGDLQFKIAQLTAAKANAIPFGGTAIDKNKFERQKQTMGSEIGELQHEIEIMRDHVNSQKHEVEELEILQREINTRYPDLKDRLETFRQILGDTPVTATATPDEVFQPDGYVYLVSIPSGYYKIGRSIKPVERIKAFDTAYPEEPTLEHTIPCRDHVKSERELQDMFAAKRIRKTEWYTLSVADVAFIKSINRM